MHVYFNKTEGGYDNVIIKQSKVMEKAITKLKKKATDRQTADKQEPNKNTMVNFGPVER